jgi:hypothetical protein
MHLRPLSRTAALPGQFCTLVQLTKAVELNGDALGPAAGTRSRKSQAPPEPPPGLPLVDEEVVVCTTEERTAVVAELAKQLGLPYVPLVIMLAEGELEYESK